MSIVYGLVESRQDNFIRTRSEVLNEIIDMQSVKTNIFDYDSSGVGVGWMYVGCPVPFSQ